MMININNATFTLPQGLSIIKDIACKIKQHDFIVLLGSNGSGKSTLVKLLNRTYRLSSGSINLDNQNINKFPDTVYSKKVITLTQFVRESLFFDLTIEENALIIETAYTKKQFSRKKFCENLKSYLYDFNPKLADAAKSPLYNLSGGEQQILAFALYLRHQPELLLLDEHTSALDPKTAIKIMQFTADIINKKNLTCVMTTHNLDFAIQYGNRVLALNEGKIVFDSENCAGQQFDRHYLLEKCY